MIRSIQSLEPLLRVPLGFLLAALTLATLAAAAPPPPQKPAASGGVYYTVGVLEPDRLASAWLIRRFVDPGARVLLLPEGTDAPAAGEAFDLPGARWQRSGSQSTYERILETESIEDPALVAIGRLIRAGELAYWLLEPGSAADRFDRTMKSFSLDRDEQAAYDYLDRVYHDGGKPPEHP